MLISIRPASSAVSAASRCEFADRLEDEATALYLAQYPDANLRALSFDGADYIVDERPGFDRTVVVLAPPTAPGAFREHSYQRGYPLSETLSGRPADRGHFIAHSAGGAFGPNMFTQDRALNRGWSRDGRAYRALERAAIAAGSEALLFVRPVYVDESAPALIELGFWDTGQVQCSVFRNRFDDAALGDADRFEAALAAATNAEAAALGEETARVLLETELGGIYLDGDDSASERVGHRHGLDLVMLVDDSVVSFEVKTRHVSRDAGRLTRAGSLRRPRLRAPRTDGFRQGSDDYVALRASSIIDVGGPHGHPESHVVVVDFVSMLAQLFPLSAAGRVGSPLGLPMPCTDAAKEAFAHIMSTRQSLAPPRSV